MPAPYKDGTRVRNKNTDELGTIDGYVTARNEYEVIYDEDENQTVWLVPASRLEQVYEAGPDECDTGVALTKAIDDVLAEDNEKDEG